MTLRLPFFALLALLAISSLHATAAATQEQEYQQVRTIALRDPKVRAAYEEADRKLDAKILQIDPALATYLRMRANKSEAPPMTKIPPSPTPAHAAKPAKPSAPATKLKSHTVAKGETLGTIAGHYGVKVAALKSANHIGDEKKLAVGQVLTVPAR